MNKNELKQKPVDKKPVDKSPETNFLQVSPEGLKFNFKAEMKPKEKIWDLNPDLVQTAYDKIVVMWNKDQKSRNFIKHLIAGFLPYEPMYRMLNAGPDPLFCAITNLKLTGVGEIAKHYGELGVQRMFSSAHAMVIESENREETEEEKAANLAQQEKIAGMIKAMPREVQNVQIGVSSDSSTKYLMVETIQALLHFSTTLLMFGDDEMSFLLKKSQINKTQQNRENKITPSEVNKVAAAVTFGLKSNVSEKTYSALEKLKMQLEEEKE